MPSPTVTASTTRLLSTPSPSVPGRQRQGRPIHASTDRRQQLVTCALAPRSPASNRPHAVGPHQQPEDHPMRTLISSMCVRGGRLLPALAQRLSYVCLRTRPAPLEIRTYRRVASGGNRELQRPDRLVTGAALTKDDVGSAAWRKARHDRRGRCGRNSPAGCRLRRAAPTG
jgi:hypothetical protein